MGNYNLAQRTLIIRKNPQKQLVKHAHDENKKLMMHLYGIGIKEAMKREDYFENSDVYKSRSEKPMSNKDLFARVLQQEEMVFTARGGSCTYGLPAKQEAQMNEILNNVVYGINLHKWVENFALPAYRADPMGLILMETAESFATVDENTNMEDFRIMDMPVCYPTYRSIKDVYDYLPNGRRIEYVVFQLSVKELVDYGIEDDRYVNYPELGAGHAHGKYPMESKTPYFRFIDDTDDTVYKLEEQQLVPPVMKQPQSIIHPWKMCPALIASDVIFFAKPRCFCSPLFNVIELADDFLYSRSIRDLQKRYHGFAKAIEPLLQCPTCGGTGLAKGSACPDCTPNGQNMGIGYKIKTKVQDVAKFPLDVFAEAGFDFRKIFGYITPDIESWRQQDLSLDQCEQLIHFTYWGSRRDPPTTPAKTTGGVGGALEETATKTLANLQPKYARLNRTADWAESTEKWIADMMGEYYFPNSWKGAMISYGRNYILESVEDLRDSYYDARDNGMSEVMLDDMLEKIIRAEYATNPNRMEYYLKLLQVEPFPHLIKDDAKGLIPRPEDWQAEVYYREWVNTLEMAEVLTKDVADLKKDLADYITSLEIKPPPVPPPPPIVVPGAKAEQGTDAEEGEHGKKEIETANEQN